MQADVRAPRPPFEVFVTAAVLVACFVLALASCKDRDKRVTPQGESGSLARDYLSDAKYSSMLVEVDYIQGFAPRQAALDFLRQRLVERCSKPDGISIAVNDAIPDQGISTWRLSDIQALERRYRGAYAGGTHTVLYVAYLNGASEWDGGGGAVLGVSYTGSSFAIFKENVEASSTPVLTGSLIERVVLVHEAGHNLGLVNNGIPMRTPHEDPSHPAHDVNSACIMYWAVETSAIAQVLNAVPEQFDAECIDDMRDAGGL